ncbi:MAG: hypothetical protein K2K23_03650, partial [Muribaculaceae bacterium]|nr:hypothetical protein [Muribaculaceae bacterium]
MKNQIIGNAEAFLFKTTSSIIGLCLMIFLLVSCDNSKSYTGSYLFVDQAGTNWQLDIEPNGDAYIFYTGEDTSHAGKWEKKVIEEGTEDNEEDSYLIVSFSGYIPAITFPSGQPNTADTLYLKDNKLYGDISNMEGNVDGIELTRHALPIQENNEPGQSYTDDNGQTYYLDQNGQPYYLDQNGNAYYIDQNGQPYYLDQNGNAYYLDQNGQAYYIDQNGNAYYLDQNGQAYYIDQNGNAYYLDQNG